MSTAVTTSGISAAARVACLAPDNAGCPGDPVTTVMENDGSSRSMSTSVEFWARTTTGTFSWCESCFAGCGLRDTKTDKTEKHSLPVQSRTPGLQDRTPGRGGVPRLIWTEVRMGTPPIENGSPPRTGTPTHKSGLPQNGYPQGFLDQTPQILLLCLVRLELST